jgi:hypothetical protein
LGPEAGAYDVANPIDINVELSIPHPRDDQIATLTIGVRQREATARSIGSPVDGRQFFQARLHAIEVY